MTTMHVASNLPLLMIRRLPQVPHESEFEQWFSITPALSTSDRAQVLNEVWDATQQLSELRAKLLNPMEPDANVVALHVIRWLMAGSRKTTRALTCVEVLEFVRRITPDFCRENAWQEGGNALRVILDCCLRDPHKFGDVFLSASPNELIAMIAMLLPHGVAADVSDGSFCRHATELVQVLVMHLEGDAREVAHNACAAHIWPILVDLLLVPEVPTPWLVCGEQISERLDARMERAMNRRSVAKRTRVTIPSFLERLLSTLRCFQDVGLVRASEACFPLNLLERIDDLSRNQRLPEYPRNLCREALDILKPATKSERAATRRRWQAVSGKFGQALRSHAKQDMMELSTCGPCGAQETEAVRFQWCSGCNIERYCSVDCQKKDW
eukprot:CAMPEP_0117474824 /NCGR_PEP_ID=MMETSP0784-20121206/9480_1 /TAXON_ID=39447 /ORGANISM="" /LENGTH=382 /DNA_ID=CAMNT_0005269055 /DNA_START=45 /DNA_END=1190 /DNA_ORIENTATION=-